MTHGYGQQGGARLWDEVCVGHGRAMRENWENCNRATIERKKKENHSLRCLIWKLSFLS